MRLEEGLAVAGARIPSVREGPRKSAADKFTVVLESAGLNTTELCAFSRQRAYIPVEVGRWRRAAEDANAQPMLTMGDQKVLHKRHKEDQREIKRLQQEMGRKEKAPTEAAAPLLAAKRSRPSLGRARW